jgi:hypothetical protein
MFGLESRLVTDVDKFDKNIIDDNIDYVEVNKRLEQYRIMSLDFISNALS